jgi:hypothetical protein
VTGEVGIIYLLHFDEPLGDVGRSRMSAQHYVGWAKDGKLQDRLHEHELGNGAAITRAAVERGIGWTVVRLVDGTRDDERRLKRNGNHKRRCSICRPGRKVRLPQL